MTTDFSHLTHAQLTERAQFARSAFIAAGGDGPRYEPLPVAADAPRRALIALLTEHSARLWETAHKFDDAVRDGGTWQDGHRSMVRATIRRVVALDMECYELSTRQLAAA